MQSIKQIKQLYKINNRIKNEVCLNTINYINDTNLLHIYKNTKSVQKKINTVNNILDEYYIPIHIKNSIQNKLITEIIPPGTKGVIKGNIFNKIVKQFIIDLNFDPNNFEINFETKISTNTGNSNNYSISEIPDWYIYSKIHNKYLIGMNQLDLWSGGHQINRGYKYINNSTNTGNSTNSDYKIVCVICNNINIKSVNNKVYKLFDIGFTNNSLCYLNNLSNIIHNYFK